MIPLLFSVHGGHIVGVGAGNTFLLVLLFRRTCLRLRLRCSFYVNVVLHFYCFVPYFLVEWNSGGVYVRPAHLTQSIPRMYTMYQYIHGLQ